MSDDLREQEARKQMAPPTVVKENSALDNLAKLRKADKLYKKAQALREAGEMDSAREYYDRVQKLCPGSRFDPYEPMEPRDPAAGPPPRRRPAPNGTTATHHPISQVRYRKAAGGDEPLDDRPRRPRRPAGDSWD